MNKQCRDTGYPAKGKSRIQDVESGQLSTRRCRNAGPGTDLWGNFRGSPHTRALTVQHQHQPRYVPTHLRSRQKHFKVLALIPVSAFTPRN